MTGSPRRLHLCSTPAPLEDDDLLVEILLRLPPKPSSLPRASAVCTRWRGIVSDPVFLRRFRLRHRRNAPILGCFRTDQTRRPISFNFVPALEPPDRVPAQRFSVQLGDLDNFRPLNSRDGLVLMYLWERGMLLVWDPVTRNQHRISLPRGFLYGFLIEEERIDGAVLRADGVVHHFQVVLVGMEKDRKRAIARVYSSETGLWGNLVSTLLPDAVLTDTNFTSTPALLVGDSVYWFVTGGSSRILGFDLHRQMLTVIPVPVDMTKEDCFMFTRAEGGELGFLIKSGCKVQLWKRETVCDGVASWALGRTIELDKLLPLDPDDEESSFILWYAESSNVICLGTYTDHFMVQLESLEVEKTVPTPRWYLQPFECVFTGDTRIGGAQGGADLLHNA